MLLWLFGLVLVLSWLSSFISLLVGLWVSSGLSNRLVGEVR